MNLKEKITQKRVKLHKTRTIMQTLKLEKNTKQNIIQIHMSTSSFCAFLNLHKTSNFFKIHGPNNTYAFLF